MGFEPTIFWFVVRRLIRWATRPMLKRKKCEVHGSQFSWRPILWMHHMRVNRHSSCDGRVVKALDLKSNGIFPRRFEPYSQRYFLNWFPLLAVQQEPYLMCQISLAAMAEWLRRLTRNQMGSSRVGSNPTRSVRLFSNSITLLEKVCIVGESNPGLPRGRREFYHWTNNACVLE